MTAKPVFVLNGPTLNLLGTREPEIYGTTTLDDINAMTAARAKTHGLSVDFRQTNREGELVDWLIEARERACGVILNGGAYTHTSIALYDAIKAIKVPVIEVHLSNPYAREPFRHHSYVSHAATGVICGLRAQGYEFAVDGIAALVLGGKKGKT